MTDIGNPRPVAFWRVATVIGTGIFVTGLGWPGLIGRLPFGLLLKNQLRLEPQAVAAFWAVATAAWYVKPLFGLLCDAWPLFGTQRRGTLLLGSGAATGAWMAFALVPRSFASLLVVMTALNLALVVVSASVGGLLVEEGQRRGATGRLSAMRTALEGVMSLVAGPLAGELATRAFGVTVAAGAATLAVMLPVTWLLLQEPRRASPETRAVWAKAAADLRAVVRSRALVMTALLLFLVYVSPGLQTPLLYYQQDVLRLTPRMMGWLQTAGGAGVLVGAALYAWLCRRFSLRFTLIAGLAVNAAAALLYLGYRSAASALVIDGLAGLLGAMGTLPLYDLVARATPRGSESFGFALMMSVRSVAQFGLSDPLGAWLYGRLHVSFQALILVNAASTLAVLLFIPWLPAALLARREGARAGAA